jgi:hypothetical protein
MEPSPTLAFLKSAAGPASSPPKKAMLGQGCTAAFSVIRTGALLQCASSGSDALVATRPAMQLRATNILDREARRTCCPDFL